MTWKIKAIIIASALVVIFAFGAVLKALYDAKQQLKYIETSMVESKQIGEGIIRSQGKYASREDLERIIKEQNLNLEAIKKDLEKFQAKPTAVNTFHVRSSGFSGSNLASTESTPNPEPVPSGGSVKDKFKYLENTQWLKLNEPFSDGTQVPMGRAGFSAWREKPWDLEIKPRSYYSTTVLGQDAEGRHYAHSQFQIEVDGKTYTVPVADAKLVEEVPSASFSFNPRLYLGVDGGAVRRNDNTMNPIHAELLPNIGIGLFSYGKTKTNPEWSFPTIGVGYASQSETVAIHVAPVNYNVGQVLPLIENLHLGPSISVDFNGTVGIYVGARVGL